MLKYGLFGGSGVAPEERISKELVRVIKVANARLLCYPFSGKRIVRISTENIKGVVGNDKARDVVVEAMRKADRIIFDVHGGSWLMFSDVSFDGGGLVLTYRAHAASLLKALGALEDKI